MMVKEKFQRQKYLNRGGSKERQNYKERRDRNIKKKQRTKIERWTNNEDGQVTTKIFIYRRDNCDQRFVTVL